VLRCLGGSLGGVLLALGVNGPVMAGELPPLRLSTVLSGASGPNLLVFESDEPSPPQLNLSQSLAAADLPERGETPGDLPLGKGAGSRIAMSEVLSYDSNVFRLRDAAAASAAGLSGRGSWHSLTRLELGLDKRHAGQQWLLDLEANANRYGSFDFLNHTTRTAVGRWRWSAGPDWQGEVGAEHREALDDYAYFRNPVRSIATTRVLSGSAFYRLTNGWQVGTQVAEGSRRYKDGTRPTNELDFGTVDLILRYAPEGRGTATLTRRRARGQYPNAPADDAGTLAEKRFQQEETSLELSLPTGTGSRYLMRVASVSREYGRYPQSNYSGHSALVGAEWQVTPRSQLSGVLRYDVEPAQDFVSSYVATRGARLGWIWAYSPRTRLEGRYEWRDAQYRGDPGFGVAVTSRREDKVGQAQLTATHQMSPRLRWILSLLREQRESNQAEWSYTDWTMAGSVQWAF
jgi:hypothetical protein